MSDESTRRAAQEYLAAKITDEGQNSESKQNVAAAIALAPAVWKRVRDTMVTDCSVWNAVTQEQTFTCTDTALGDLRVWCADRSLQMTVHYDSNKRLITIRNMARLEHETDVILRIEGYSTGSSREAHLVRNHQPVNIEMLILGELRVLAGIGRQAKQ